MINHETLQFSPPKSAEELTQLGKQLLISKQILGMGLYKEPAKSPVTVEPESPDATDPLHEIHDKCKTALYAAISNTDPDIIFKSNILRRAEADNLSDNSDPEEESGPEGNLWGGGIDSSIQEVDCESDEFTETAKTSFIKGFDDDFYRDITRSYRKYGPQLDLGPPKQPSQPKPKQKQVAPQKSNFKNFNELIKDSS